MHQSRVRLVDKPQRLVEWPMGLSKSDLLELGWRPTPFNEFVVKVHSRCNLACDYCYIYEMNDTVWREMPGAMSIDTARMAARRIAEHADEHELLDVILTLHGGEPLLLGARRLADLLEVFRSTLGRVATPHFGIQTNGLLLTPEVISVLDEYDVGIGISLDGGRTENDRHRRRKNGDGSFEAVAERVHSLRTSRHAHLFNSLLATVDLENDPYQTYSSLCDFQPPSLDFLLPHANWESPPYRSDLMDAPYGEWLIAVYDIWSKIGSTKPSIRLFDQIKKLLRDEPSTFESIGVSIVRLVTIDTDGSYALVDALKSAFHAADRTQLHVERNTLDDVLAHPAVAARQLKEAGLSPVCRECEIRSVCGAGYYPHRYKRGTGFLNPSVYCNDLMALIWHIRDAK